MVSRLPRPRRAPADPCCLVIFGASGDLTQRLLLPALYNLAVSGLLPDAFALIGVGAQRIDRARHSATICAKSLPKFATRKIDDSVIKRLLACVAYVQGDPDDDATYEKLGKELTASSASHGTKGNRLFYLATPPRPSRRSAAISASRSGTRRERRLAARRHRKAVRHRSRLGARRSTKSCLASSTRSRFTASTIISARRRCRTSWCCASPTACSSRSGTAHHIDHVQITVAETLDGRTAAASYYDATGALRDMVPNHLFQLLSLIAMEPPAALPPTRCAPRRRRCSRRSNCRTNDEALRDGRARPIRRRRIDDQAVEAYRRTPRTSTPDSTTETYVALQA